MRARTSSAARVARVLEVVLDPIERRLGLGVLDLEPRHDERARAVGAQDECDGALGRHEGESGVVEDVVGVEEHDPCQAGRVRLCEQGLATSGVLLVRNGDRREHRCSLVMPRVGEDSAAKRSTFSA